MKLSGAHLAAAKVVTIADRDTRVVMGTVEAGVVPPAVGGMTNVRAP